MDEPLDIRALTDDQGVEQTAARFSDLELGESFLLQSDRSLVTVLDGLEERLSDQVGWRPLVDGPPLWQVIVRRPPMMRRKVLEFMTADHRHIHQLLEQMANLTRERSHDELFVAARHLDTALRKHIAMEEELLMPLISANFGTLRGPAAVLRDEHIQALDLLGSLLSASEAGTWGGADPHEDQAGRDVSALVDSLDALLRSHSGMEERILYAITDLVLSPEERQELLRRCQRV